MNTKIFLLLFGIIILSKNVISQTATFEYQNDTNYDQLIFDIAENSNNSYSFIGAYHNINSNKYEGYLLKLDKTGQFIEKKYFTDSSYTFMPINILSDSNGTSIICFAKSDTTGSYKNYSIGLFKLDTNLSITKLKQYNFPYDYSEFTQTMRRGLNNKLLITGTVNTPVNPGYGGGYRMFIYVFNQDFDSLKGKIFIHDTHILSYEIKELNNGDLWVLRGLSPYYVLIDSNLNLISAQESYIPHWINSSYGLKWDTDTSFYLAGDYFAGFKGTMANNIGKGNLLINDKLENDRITDHDIGFIRQYSPFDTTGYIFNSVGAKDTFDFPAFYGALDYTNKDSIFIGSSKNLSWRNLYFANFPSWFRLFQTDSMLNIRWEHFYGGDACYNLDRIIATHDGGCIMAGTRFDYKSHPNLHKRDIYIIKVNSEGLLTSANGKPAPIVHNAIVFPNPGREVLRIRVAVQYKQSLFQLFNMNGKLILKQEITGKSAIVSTTLRYLHLQNHRRKRVV